MLVETSQAIAEGDLNQRTNIRSSDEIGMLAVNFDEMTNKLSQRTHELEKAYLALEQMDRTKISFIDVAAHELRTPLTLVKGYTQMLASKGASDASLAPLAQGILNGTNRMLEVVSSMLDVSRIDSQTLKVIPELLEIGSIITLVSQEFHKAVEERQLNYRVEDLSNLPAIQADPDLLHKLFYHLIVNAIKYTPDGGSIQISGREVQKPGSPAEVEIVVQDSGIGIDRQHHELVFEKFYQTGEVLFHSSGKTKYKGGGPGLGLAIARGIVQAHGGKIWVESPGHDEINFPGSRFYVRLPLQGANL
jgi:signal transduction histidine kinase